MKKMFLKLVLLCLCLWRLDVVFGDGERAVAVSEGDSVSLNSDTEVKDDDVIQWSFEKTLIAEINKRTDRFAVYDDDLDGRFRDRLKLDKQTGSLTITNTTTEHAGEYELQINRIRRNFKLFVLAPLPVPVISSNSSHCSSSCSLVCSSVLSVSDATLSWYAGMSVLSSISVSDLSISLSLPLEVENQDKNTYSCVLNNPISNQTTHLDINTLCRHTCEGGGGGGGIGEEVEEEVEEVEMDEEVEVEEGVEEMVEVEEVVVEEEEEESVAKSKGTFFVFRDET
ncbi:lymphocyte function-associated antigen 3-like [Pimephales promelas]|uniref:lymphocyte function-associated antigen 3-like n=1 Tax=Pimephales promelas TaxID=90988 RepID=UPI0019557B4B|nr:lymphocyte function-associated antigen 3-like [Pimephales promelas]